MKMLLPIAKFCEIYPWPSPSRMRWMVWKFGQKERLQWVIRMGTRVLIDPEKFFEWVRINDSTKDPG